MENFTSKLSALLLICMLFISSVTPILGCGYCTKPPIHKRKTPKTPPIVKPPVVRPPLVTKPPLTKPPFVHPPVVKPPVTHPPVVPVHPPIGGGRSPPKGKHCPPPPRSSPPPATCPIDTLKLSTCVDLLGGLVHIGLGDPAVNECCPILEGLVELEAAVCLCSTLKLKLLNLNIFVPIALQILATCGKNSPPGYTCTL